MPVLSRGSIRRRLETCGGEDDSYLEYGQELIQFLLVRTTIKASSTGIQKCAHETDTEEVICCVNFR
jgi:hypothetical protein